jgi:chromosome segregation ATPase
MQDRYNTKPTSSNNFYPEYLIASQSLNQVNTEIQRLTQENSNLKKSNTTIQNLQTDLEYYKKTAESIEDKVKQQDEEIIELKKQLEDYNNKTAVLELTLKKTLEKKENPEAFIGQIRAQNEEIKKLTQENETLQGNVTKMYELFYSNQSEFEIEKTDLVNEIACLKETNASLAEIIDQQDKKETPTLKTHPEIEYQQFLTIESRDKEITVLKKEYETTIKVLQCKIQEVVGDILILIQNQNKVLEEKSAQASTSLDLTTVSNAITKQQSMHDS